jgi:hypothetical protein
MDKLNDTPHLRKYFGDRAIEVDNKLLMSVLADCELGDFTNHGELQSLAMSVF